jgi:hypothetical protein
MLKCSIVDLENIVDSEVICLTEGGSEVVGRLGNAKNVINLAPLLSI